ncbi:MAG: hypothetical protein HY847_06560 [Betaproteobacteria bacterium]|nr:hypothetical protein [Betaproteobacteria bacterium]
MSQPAEWFENLVIDGGIVRRSDGKLAIGAVLVIEKGTGEIIVVTKARKPGYAFSDLDALPGGLLRSTGSDPIERSVLDRIAIESLARRSAAEAGFVCAVSPKPIYSVGPPTTSYVVGGVQQYVLVVPYSATAASDFTPVAADRSVTAARWMDPLAVIPNLSPASCIIVCSVMWTRFSSVDRTACRPALETAVESCQEWARQVGAPPVDVSWLR